MRACNARAMPSYPVTSRNVRCPSICSSAADGKRTQKSGSVVMRRGPFFCWVRAAETRAFSLIFRYERERFPAKWIRFASRKRVTSRIQIPVQIPSERGSGCKKINGSKSAWLTTNKNNSPSGAGPIRSMFKKCCGACVSSISRISASMPACNSAKTTSPPIFR